MAYYSAKEKKETMPFVTTWMNQEGITLSETGKAKHVNKQNKTQLTDTENRLVAVRWKEGWRVGKMGEGDPGAQTSSYKISHGDGMYSMVTIVNNIVLQT